MLGREGRKPVGRILHEGLGDQDFRTTPEAVELLQRGALALSRVEAAGVRVDRAYLDAAVRTMDGQIDDLTAKLRSDKVYREWRGAYGDKANLSSRSQLAHVVFDVLGYKSSSTTATGRAKADKVSLESVDLEFVRDYLRAEELKKARSTYLDGIRREMVLHGDGLWYVHPSYSLNTVVSHRSSCCVARGTPIEVVRDVSSLPAGVPIEQVKKGDLVYCYDSRNKLTIRKVLWAGMTGHDPVIRLHWRSGASKTVGHVDLTSNHPVRLTTGTYRPAGQLRPGDRVMALARSRIVPDRLFPTGMVEGSYVVDHRFVYEKLVGPIPAGHHVHHKNHNHYDNDPGNLEVLSQPEHSIEHNPGVAKMSKYQILRVLAESSGKSARVPYDFDSFRRRAGENDINLKVVKDRYTSDGRYISRGRLLFACGLGIHGAKKYLAVNHYRVWRIAEERGFSFPKLNNRVNTVHRAWNNHVIVKVESLHTSSDVFDLHVEGEHNFIAGELCVHNSGPNYQNIPVRNPELAAVVRRCYVPRPGNHFVEVDFSQIEVRVEACYSRDPNLIRYIQDKSTDMHRDMACQIFMIPVGQVTKEVRHTAKNRFVFPEFYGAVYFQCAKDIWEAVMRQDMKPRDGTSVIDHLRSKGVTELGDCDPDALRRYGARPGTFVHHLKGVQEDFWGRRFKVDYEWKQQWYEDYLRDGGFMTKTGFWVGGVFKRNEVLNLPVQGSAFQCELWSLIRLVEELDRCRMKTLLVGEIHDSDQGDVPPGELQAYLDLQHAIKTVELPRAWPWIIVPLETEDEVADADASWHDKRVWTDQAGVWAPAKK